MHETIINNTEITNILDLIPYHEAYEADKLSVLTEDMAIRGWTGTPLVKFDNQLMTGSHRYQAAVDAGLSEIPTVDYFDVFTVDEDDANEIVADSADVSWVVDLTCLALDSDAEIANELGMDAH